VRIAAYTALLLIVVGYAIHRGGEPERSGAAVLLWLSFGTFLFRPFIALNYLSIDMGTLIVDLVGLAGFLYLGLKIDRTWTIWACSAQVIAVTGHVVRYMQLQEAPLAYAVMIRGPAYIQCLALLIGTLAYRRKGLKAASSTSWQT
jgi:hypothetical protein